MPQGRTSEPEAAGGAPQNNESSGRNTPSISSTIQGF